MANTSYLFGDSLPSALTAGLSDTSSSLPGWLQEYTRALAGQATEVAGGEFQPYTPPANAATYGEDASRIAGFTPMQQQAFDLTQQNVGSYQPYTQYASQTLPQAIGSYMNPYTDSVVNRIGELGQRNLTEQLLPQVNSTFTGTGQFGSSRNADFTNRALRDANESILGQQANALQTGYQQSSQNALADLQRYGALGQLQQQLGFQDAAMLGTAGQQQQAQQQANMDLGYQDFAKQNEWQKQNLDWLSQIIRGLPANQSTYTSQTMAPTAQSQISPLAAAAQGFLGARSLATPTYTQQQQQTTR